MKKVLRVTLTNAELTRILGGELTGSFGDIYFNDEKVADFLDEGDGTNNTLSKLEGSIIRAVREALETTLLKDTDPADAAVWFGDRHHFRSDVPLEAVIQFDLP